MRKGLHFVSLLLGASLVTTLAMGQVDRFAYAVTDAQQDGSNWSFLRKLNLSTGEYGPVLLDGFTATPLAYDAGTKKQLAAPLIDLRYGSQVNAAFGMGVAAAAYDKSNNRLFYTPMFVDQLRYVDLKTMKVYFVDQPLTGMTEKSSDQGNIVTRMVIASDGNGYAMTNDATHLIQFTTGKKIKITDLGSLVDDPSNKGISIHNSCSSYGGDMIADDNGNLYVFSARNHVYKVNIETKVATHLGMVNGLPANFTINGAAVYENNRVVLSSAVKVNSYFTVDPATWNAAEYKISGTLWFSSDLANSNLLSTTKSNPVVPQVLTKNTPVVTPGMNKIQVFPNPVTNNRFVVQFSDLTSGMYTLEVTDVMGRQVAQRSINISGDNQTQTVDLNPANARGVYLVKVTDNNTKAVYTTKLMVQ
ncbi:MAG TPA: T9SS type A sorting domain-containing protein [Chitinophagaceae bacterium]|nr:T9SS type A sorting domain-containing protein [Chitinophagaceae bacterium]